MIEGEQEVVRQRIRNLLVQDLAETDRLILGYFSQQQRKLDQLVGELKSVDDFRAAARREPLIQQIVLLDSDGAILFPNLNGALSDRERRFLMRMERILVDKDLVVAATGSRNTVVNVPPSGSATTQVPRQVAHAATEGREDRPSSGWFTWFWGKGLQIIHWSRVEDGRVVACCLSRARWTADLVERLPNTASSSKSQSLSSLVRLVDSEGRAIYQWGEHETKSTDVPLVSLDLSTPLASWRLQHFGPTEILDSGGYAARLNLLIAGALLATSLVGLAAYLTREMGRRLGEATQRVTFVNQVSHELKTPLTNIRMYADLLSEDLDRVEQNDAVTRRHLAVISDESTRLSRLIGNVLAFARHRRTTLSLQCRSLIMDDVIRSVVQQFQPSLDRLGINVATNLNASTALTADEDAVGQILGNLISNVEKYAAEGKYLKIESHQSGKMVTVDVVDRGSGVPTSHRERIFEPFERVTNRIENATGTGIGLAIARQLAQLHGGDLQLVDSDDGAHFRLTIFDQAKTENLR